jgi:hypothetical protein
MLLGCQDPSTARTSAQKTRAGKNWPASVGMTIFLAARFEMLYTVR